MKNLGQSKDTNTYRPFSGVFGTIGLDGNIIAFESAKEMIELYSAHKKIYDAVKK